MTVWVLAFLPVLLAFGGLVLDGGRQVGATQEAVGLAEQAARSAVDQLDTDSRSSGVAAQFRQVDPAAAQRAACSYVRAARPAAACSVQAGPDGQVRVQVTVTTPTVLLRLAGVGSLTATGAGQARPAFGATQEVR